MTTNNNVAADIANDNVEKEITNNNMTIALHNSGTMKIKKSFLTW